MILAPLKSWVKNAATILKTPFKKDHDFYSGLVEAAVDEAVMRGSVFASAVCQLIGCRPNTLLRRAQSRREFLGRSAGVG